MSSSSSTRRPPPTVLDLTQSSNSTSSSTTSISGVLPRSSSVSTVSSQQRSFSAVPTVDLTSPEPPPTRDDAIVKRRRTSLSRAAAPETIDVDALVAADEEFARRLQREFERGESYDVVDELRDAELARALFAREQEALVAAAYERVRLHPAAPPPPYRGGGGRRNWRRRFRHNEFVHHSLYGGGGLPALAPSSGLVGGVRLTGDALRLAQRELTDADYETLLALDDNVRPNRGASEALIAQLPTRVLGAKGETCVICMEEMTRGASVTTLPCAHQFHDACIHAWLVVNKRCPIDKEAID